MPSGSSSDEATYPVRVAVEATGLSAHVLRAWERRYSIVEPRRTRGGSRRYRMEDIDRLRLAKAAVSAGHRIGDLAGLSEEELRACGDDSPIAGSNAISRVLSALRRFDEAEAEREIGVQLLALGSVEFCRGFVAPLLDEIGEEWAADRLCPASEHLGSALIRSALGAVLRTARRRCVGPTALFATPSPEAHELGALLAAIVAASAGVTPRFLGGSLPVSEIVAASEASSADVVALSVVSTEHSSVAADIGSLRESLPASTQVWVGGRGSLGLVLPTNVARIPTLDELDARARALCLP